MSEDDGSVPREVESSASRARYAIHWVTHVRRRGLGMWAWLLHRLTAILALIGIVAHVLRNQFGYPVPGGRLIAVDLLVFSVSYHMFNGVRVIFIEASGWAARNEEKLFLAVVASTLIFIGLWIYVVGF